MPRHEKAKLDLDCPRCGWRLENVGAWLKPRDTMSCDCCGAVIALEPSSEALKSRDAA